MSAVSTAMARPAVGRNRCESATGADAHDRFVSHGSGKVVVDLTRGWGRSFDRQKSLDRQVTLTGVVVEAEHGGAGCQLGQLLRDRGQRGA